MADKAHKDDAPKGSTAAKSTKGPHGGGTDYNQMAVGKGFMAHNPIPGHVQKKNVKPSPGLEGGSK